jgi:hypothetical protein
MACSNRSIMPTCILYLACPAVMPLLCDMRSCANTHRHRRGWCFPYTRRCYIMQKFSLSERFAKVYSDGQEQSSLPPGVD